MTPSGLKTCLSFGAGVQTTALLVIIADGRWPRPDVILFADTGNEHPNTYQHLNQIGAWAAERGMDIKVLGREWRTAHNAPSLADYCFEHRTLPGTMVRWCTDRWKVKPMMRYRRQMMGATAENPVEAWIGISTDEQRRAKPSVMPAEVKRYPLIELGLSRSDCATVIRDAGLPVPPKSGCTFCPFKRRAEWQAMKRDEPELFALGLAMERNARPRKKDGRKPYLPIFGSLEQVAAQEEFPMFDAMIDAESSCVSGACFV